MPAGPSDFPSAPNRPTRMPRRPVIDHRRYWLALYRRDPAAAERIVRAHLERFPPHHLYLRLFTPALNLSGTRFALGQISYHDEHYITHHTLLLLRLARRQLPQSPPNGFHALATGVAQDSHRIGLRMVCDLLASAGWSITELPTHESGTLRHAILDRRPHALLLSIGRADAFPAARRLIRHARSIGFTGPIAVGGRAIAESTSAVPVLGATLTATSGLDLARKLARLLPPPSQQIPPKVEQPRKPV